MRKREQLTSAAAAATGAADDEQKELCLAGQLEVLGGRVLHHELAGVAVGVGGPQLRQADVEGQAGRVPADRDASLVLVLGHGEVAAAVHEEHLGGAPPAALQVHAEGRLGTGLHLARQHRRFPFPPLQEEHLAAGWIQSDRWRETG